MLGKAKGCVCEEKRVSVVIQAVTDPSTLRQPFFSVQDSEFVAQRKRHSY